MIVSVRLCVILIVLFCVLNVSHSLTTKTDLHNDGISGKHDQVFSHRKRMRRALVSQGVQAAIKIGTKAVKKLLGNARFVYSDGLDSVFVKNGGMERALKDFDSVVDPKKVRNLPTTSKDKKLMTRNIGTLTLYNLLYKRMVEDLQLGQYQDSRQNLHYPKHIQFS